MSEAQYCYLMTAIIVGGTLAILGAALLAYLPA